MGTREDRDITEAGGYIEQALTLLAAAREIMRNRNDPALTALLHEMSLRLALAKGRLGNYLNRGQERT